MRCRYCYGKSCEDFGSDFHNLQIDYALPSSIEYDVQTLRDFLGGDPSPTLVFYGGEPLLMIPKMTEIMDAIPRARFVIQTNGLLLDKIDAEHLGRFESIFVSLDGNEAVTDYYRGVGTYRHVERNLRTIRDRGFEGEIVARMTVGEETEIDDQVMALAESRDLAISSVHWQLDALFWQNDFRHRQFSRWASENYNPRVRRLVGIWVDRMRKEGKVLKLYPFVGVMDSILQDESTLLRCGAGWRMFNIQTDGNITPCPVMAGLKDFYVGNIRENRPTDLRTVTNFSDPCKDCNIFRLCGGRCLYANDTKLWGDEGFGQVCGTVRNMVDALHEVLPEVKGLIEAGVIRLSDFEYAKYNGCEVIP